MCVCMCVCKEISYQFLNSVIQVSLFSQYCVYFFAYDNFFVVVDLDLLAFCSE